MEPKNPEAVSNPLVADHLNGALPEKMIEVNGRPMAAPPLADKGPEVRAREQLVDEILGRVRAGLLTRPETLAPALGEVVDLALLQNEIDREAVRVSLPFNAAQVTHGGFAMLRTCTSVREAGVTLDLPSLGPGEPVEPGAGPPVMLDLANCDPAGAKLAEHSAEGARATLENYRKALDLARAGTIEAITFTPFNKQAMRLVEPGYEDALGSGGVLVTGSVVTVGEARVLLGGEPA